jgi:hypothetical protein
MTSPLPILQENGAPFLLAVESWVSFALLPEGSDCDQLTIKHLAVLELANVAHADSVAGLDGTAGAKLAVVDGDTLNNLHTKGTLLVALVLGLVLRGTGRALLQVLGELNLLVTLGRRRLLRLGLGGDRLALVVLELLLLLLAELLLVLGHHLVETLGLLLGGPLVLALLGLDKLGSLLLLVSVDLLDARGAVDVIELIAHLVRVLVLEARREVILIIRVFLIVLLFILGNDVVASEVDCVSALDAEEDLLALTNGNVDGLLVGLR